MKLTPQREKFAQEVAAGKSLSEAYRIAYPKAAHWKPESVHRKSSELAAHVHVLARVQALRAAIVDEFVIDTRRILREAVCLATTDVAKVMNEHGGVKLPHELDPETRAAIASFEIDEKGRIKYRFWDKNSALDRIFKHKGLFEIDNRQRNPLSDLLDSLSGNVFGVGSMAGDEGEDE